MILASRLKPSSAFVLQISPFFASPMKFSSSLLVVAVLLGLSRLHAATPVIVVQPESASIVAGQSGTLAVTATGETLSYQWRHFGQPIAGATNAALDLYNVALPDAGLYDAVITDGQDVTRSQSGRIDVVPAHYGNTFVPNPHFAPRIENVGYTAWCQRRKADSMLRVTSHAPTVDAVPA